MAIEYIRPGVTGTEAYQIGDLQMRKNWQAQNRSIVAGQEGAQWGLTLSSHTNYEWLNLKPMADFRDLLDHDYFELVVNPITNRLSIHVKKSCFAYMWFYPDLEAPSVNDRPLLYGYMGHYAGSTGYNGGMGYYEVIKNTWITYESANIGLFVVAETLIAGSYHEPGFVVINDPSVIVQGGIVYIDIIKSLDIDLNA